MHCCLLLITKEIPSEDRISEILKPYNYKNFECNNKNPQIFTYDMWEIGGRYSGLLKLKMDYNDKKYDWAIPYKHRNNILFHSKLLTDLQLQKVWFDENRYYSSMGANDGFLYVDGAMIDDLINFDDVNCFICIDSNENVIIRETYNEHTFVKDKNFDEKLAKIKMKSKTMFATILDIHS